MSVGFSSLSMMEILRVYSMERLRYGTTVSCNFANFGSLERVFKILQESGSPWNLRDITAQQVLFDKLVADT